MAESFDLSALVDEFRDEARDQMDRLDAGLLRLEREGALEGGPRSELLRMLHTLKGNAGMLGLSPIRDFVHALENALKPDREVWDADLLERLFEGAAALRSAVESAGGEGEDQAFGDLATARHRLEELGSAGRESAGAVAAAEQARDEVPTASRIRVRFEQLDGMLAEVGELMGEALALERSLAERGERELRDQAERIRRRTRVLRQSVMELRLVPIGRVLGRFQGLVRRLAAEQGKEARLVVEGEGTELDKSTADALAEPLLHLVRNAIDHGIASPEEREVAGKPRHGTIRIRASREADRIRLDVEDDGAGLDLGEIRSRAESAGLVSPGAAMSDHELEQLIFRAGFSTRAELSTVSGQGVGLDVVRRSMRELRGEIHLERPPGGGTRFLLRLPLTVAIVPSLLFEAAGELMALPAAQVVRTVRMAGLERIGAAEVLREEDGLTPVVELPGVFGWPADDRGDFGVVVTDGSTRAVVSAVRLVDQRDLVVKSLPSYGPRTRAVTGGSVLPGGRVVLVLDPVELIELRREEVDRRENGR